MVILATAENLLDEIQSQKTARDNHLSHFEDLLDGYTGPYWSLRGDTDRIDPENHSFEWISLVVPQMVAGNPRFRVKSSRTGSHQDVAKAIQFGLNRWSSQSNMRRTNEKLAVDFGFNWAVAYVTREAMPGEAEFEDPKMWPVLRRIAQTDFVSDHDALEQEAWRFAGHRIRIDKDDLERKAQEDDEDGWLLTEIRALPEDTTSEDEHPADRRNQTLEVPRQTVTYWQIWVPGWDPRMVDADVLKNIPHADYKDADLDGDKYNGWLFYIAEAKDADGTEKGGFIRKAQPFFGPRWGPYALQGGYTVPNSTVPLSPIVATETQAQFLNNHVRAAGDAADSYKKLIVVNSTERKLQQAIAVADNLSVLPIDGFERGHVVEVELGGLTAQHMAILEWARAGLDRNSGIHEAMRGNVTGKATATENEIAAGASSSRIGFLIQKFQDLVAQVGMTVAWYLYYDEAIDFALGEEAAGQFFHVMSDPQTGQSVKVPFQDPAFRGGMGPESEGKYSELSRPTFDDLDMSIEPYSMERTSEGLQQMRFGQLTEFLLNVGQAMMVMPHINWHAYLELAGELMNVPNLTEIVNLEVLPQLQQMTMQAQMGGGGGEQSGTSQPRLARDTAKAQPGGKGSRGAASSGFGSLMGAPRGPLSGQTAGASIGTAQKGAA